MVLDPRFLRILLALSGIENCLLTVPRHPHKYRFRDNGRALLRLAAVAMMETDGNLPMLTHAVGPFLLPAFIEMRRQTELLASNRDITALNEDIDVFRMEAEERETRLAELTKQVADLQRQIDHLQKNR